jgi:hypothetical protein
MFHTHTGEQNNYNFVYFNIYIFRSETGKQMILNWIVVSISRI